MKHISSKKLSRPIGYDAVLAGTVMLAGTAIVGLWGCGKQATSQPESRMQDNRGQNEAEDVAAPPADDSAAPFTPTGGKGDADVLSVRAKPIGSGRWTFHVTVRHADTGWDDYANGWDVITKSGEVLRSNDDDPFSRVLLHPHVQEQPFTRSQTLEIPPPSSELRFRAHDLKDGFGGREVALKLDQNKEVSSSEALTP